jgi:lysophospholipase L1-like esterase
MVCAGQVRAETPNAFFFKSGDRIVFQGDSITEQYQYSTDIELYLTTRFPRWNLTFINAGISGDTARGGASRFAAHVLAEKPTAVTIDFGMNDGGYAGFQSGRNATYRAKTEAMLKEARKGGVRVALISPNAVDPKANKSLKAYLETQKQFYAPLQELAARYELPFVDQYAITRAVLEKRDKAEAKAVNLFPDGVHTSSQGGILMAQTILAGLHAPALVSDLDIDARSRQANTKACTVDKLQCAPAELSIDRLDEALPMPVQKDWLPILPYVNELKDLNWYGLKETGLEGGNYRLRIDGQDVGTFAADQLAAGINLGNLTSGPLHDQGQRVSQLINAKNNLVHQRFRGVVMFQAPDWLADVAADRKPKELARRMAQISTRQAAIYEAVRPVAHHFELKKCLGT